jgi:hypothetical protein
LVVREDAQTMAMRKVEITSSGVIQRVDDLFDFEILFGTLAYVL